MFYLLFILHTLSVALSFGTPLFVTSVVAALVITPTLVAIWRKGRNADAISDWFVLPTLLSSLVALTLVVENGLG